MNAKQAAEGTWAVVIRAATTPRGGSQGGQDGGPSPLRGARSVLKSRKRSPEASVTPFLSQVSVEQGAGAQKLGSPR